VGKNQDYRGIGGRGGSRGGIQGLTGLGTALGRNRVPPLLWLWRAGSGLGRWGHPGGRRPGSQKGELAGQETRRDTSSD
jgi:hypothetical protein